VVTDIFYLYRTLYICSREGGRLSARFLHNRANLDALMNRATEVARRL